MKKDKRLIAILLATVMIASSLLLTACFRGGDDEEPSDLTDEVMTLSLDLESDSENGVTWKFEQNAELFSYEDVFLQDEGYEGEGSGEVQSFTLRPVKPGEVSIRFINKTTETVYTYDCQISDNLDEITVTKTEGESAGEAVQPPNVVLERN